MIEINTLSYRYPGADTPALNGISMQIETGDLFGLLGPNGAGKTTLISLLTGLKNGDNGTISYDNKDIREHKKQLQAQIAWVPQEYAFYPVMSVSENLRFFGRTLGLSGATLNKRVSEVIEVTGLNNALERRCETFSGGMKRRLNVAIGLLGKPAYLFLDEPTVGIDPQSRHFILEAIKHICESGTTVVYSSHYMEEVQYLCNCIAIIDNGTVLTQGSLQTLLEHNNEQTDVDDISLTYYQLLNDAPESMAILPGFQLSSDRKKLLVNTLDTQSIAQQMQALAQSGVEISAVHAAQNNLENLFLRLTQRSLRD